MNKRLDHGQKGSALMQAVIIIGFTLVIGGLIAQVLGHQRSKTNQAQNQEGRNRLARQIQQSITNPQLLYLNAILGSDKHPAYDTGFMTQAPRIGNLELGKCLYYDAASNSECNSDPSQKVRPIAGQGRGLLGYPLVLIRDSKECQANPLRTRQPAGTIRSFPRDRVGVNSENIPGLDCVLAGQLSNDSPIGFNFRGEAGPLSFNFPLEVRAYMNPLCTGDNFLTMSPQDLEGRLSERCSFARQILVSFEIIHRRFEWQNGEPTLRPDTELGRQGAYPTAIDYSAVPTFLLKGQSCNPGAQVVGYTSDGNLLCKCRSPWRERKAPAIRFDERGVLCDAPQVVCPPGTITQARRSDGTLECVGLSAQGSGETKLRFQTWEETLCLGNSNDVCARDTESRADCQDRMVEDANGDMTMQLVHGWVTKIDPQCSGSVGMWPQDGGREDDKVLRISIIVGTSILTAWFFGGWGALGWIGGGAVGAAIGNFFADLFSSNDYHFPLTEPSVKCQWKVTCQAYDTSGL